ncbi:carboxylesterase/lipase family protein [Erwinia tasmaniensis]|uniref:carboxylesterase/lipase family protein n=1 Tax=Erwinia tasmaniensis TaxID=338565 RepID=UPI003A4D5F81
MKNARFIRTETAEGRLKGEQENEVCVFRGIPYAAPPVGSRRWQPPKPVQPWQEERDATQWGNASWQNREYCSAIGGGDPGSLSEDCLYLNVWSPDLTPQSPLPVMVWFHGGGFSLGSGGLPPYFGLPLAARGVVVVTINYRLGHLGFFAHPALDKEYRAGEYVNNFGLLDQIAALQWVQRNISAFGGDRDNVTIFGESAGARSVLTLFASPLTEGLFHKGIAQSAYTLGDMPREKALKNGVALAAHFTLKDATAQQLRALPAEAFYQLDGVMGSGPVAIAGDRVLPVPMLDVFSAARQHKLPLMIGSNSDEASVLGYFGIDPAKVIAGIRKTQRIGLRLRMIRLLYSGITDDSELGRQVARDMTFTTMGHLAALAQCRRGAPVWRYYFDYVSENAREIYPHGTAHGNEIPYTMDTLTSLSAQSGEPPFSDADRAFAQKVSEYWLHFARDASASSVMLAGEVVWPVWQPAQDEVMRFGEQGRGLIRLEKRFMRRRTQLFRLLISRMVRLEG